ncbi:MAG TPA: phosphatase PAP2 family protein [Candidatus Cottocaccamicrobium excrementipullorum]|nr:phosphatase PAP2 family protein [Candidatus Cottocaccamicrobium excrementipullorum]
MKCSKLVKQAGAIGAALVMTASPCLAATADPSAIEPVPGPHGYFVDTYKTNSSDNMTPESNAVIGVLSPFLSIWAPGDSWNNGQKLGEAGNLLLDQNIQICINMTNSRTEEQALTAYLTDRRNQNWSALDGLGPYETAFKQLSNAGTSLPAEIPADAETKKYSDKGNANGNWADTDSALGSMVELVNTVRGPHASGNPAKIYFQYMRPFRWSSEVNLLPALKPCASDPMTDGGFPSGHTNAGYLASLALAYAVPERFQQLLANASEIGNYRIIAGMHSPMDVMGGRTMATALAAAALNDPENAELKASARSQAQSILLQNPGQLETMYFENDGNNAKMYHDRLTYNLPQTGDTTKPMTVPKGAEVLLETRFPYLDADQRRWVLYSTGLPSGYVFLDDAEGWGRLDLYSAANGYGAFNVDITASMDASQGGFNAYDEWSNDIYGEGCITKEGTGTLVLSGDNSYTGGVHVNGGTFTAASSYAFGYSSVDNHASISETVTGPVVICGDYEQTQDGTLNLDINSPEDTLEIGGDASLSGILNVDFTDYPNPEPGMVLISADQITGNFSSVQATGLDANRSIALTAEGVVVQ